MINLYHISVHNKAASGRYKNLLIVNDVVPGWLAGCIPLTLLVISVSVPIQDMIIHDKIGHYRIRPV